MTKWLLVTILLFPLYLDAQSLRGEILNPEVLTKKEMKLRAQRSAPSGIKLPFSRIKLVDSRFDTSKIGFIPGNNIVKDKRNIFRKLQLKGGTAKAIEDYYNEYYNASFAQNDFELLIVIKRFWLSGVDVGSKTRPELKNTGGFTDYLYCKWEYYLGKNGDYFPFRRIDTTLTIDEDLEKYIIDEFDEKKLPQFKFALKALIEIIDFDKAVLQYEGRTKIKIKEINVYN